jgi:4-hydroxybenzoate polyprenyltransferase
MRQLARVIHTWGAMIKFSHSVFAMPFALLAMFLAARPVLPSWTQFGLITLCMVAARSAAMTFNRIVDASVDARNPRTAERPIPTGRILLRSAWAFLLAALAVFLAGCAGFLLLLNNAWPLILCVPVVAFLFAYSYTKRYTRWSHVFLGAAIAFSPVAAWIAIRPDTLGATAWLLMLAVTLWIAGFDLIYACQDADFDRRAGLHSVPARMGIPAALWLARVFHAATVGALVLVGFSAELHTPYFVGVVCVAVLLAVENAIVRANDLSRVNLAFFTVNGVVGLVLGGLGILDVWLTVGSF